MLTEYRIRNGVIVLLIIAFLAYKLLLASQDFPGSFSSGFKRTIIFIGSIFLLLFLKVRYRGLIVISYIIITYFLSYLNLWKIATENYLIKNEKYFSSVSQRLQSDTIECSINFYSDSINYRWAKRNKEPFNNPSFQQSLLALSKNTEVVEIEKDKYILLFIFDRFIDNGYGLAYISAQNLAKINKDDRYRVNSFEITSLINIMGNWYYLSFT